MASENLNECVDSLLEKRSKAAYQQHAAALAAKKQPSGKLLPSFGTATDLPRVVIRHRVKGTKKAQKRIRKGKEQNDILMAEFHKNMHWNKSKINELQKRLHLKPSQIYKWNWDMQRKTGNNK